VLFFEEKKSRNPVYEMMKNEKQNFLKTQIEITKNAIKKHKTATQKKSKRNPSR